MSVELDGANNTVKTDTISEVTSANGVTVDGLSIKDSKLVTTNSVITANVTDNAITLAKMAGGTDGNLITYDASGDPAYVTTGSDGQVLTSTGAGSAPAFEALPATGKVLQVINAVTSTETASSSTSYADTSLTAAITPSATTSKVLVLVNQVALLKNSSDNGGKIQLLRGTTSLGMFENDFGRDGGTGLNIVGGTGMCKLDSPETTSATTYKTQFACSVSAAASVQVQHNSAVSSITLIEVGA